MTELFALMGDLPPRDRPLGARAIQTVAGPGYTAEKLSLDLNGLEQVPAWFVRPLEPAGPAPAILYNHAHGGDYALGKDELLRGRGSLQAPPYAEALAARGWCVLAIDHWGFGERATRTEMDLFKEMLWHGRVLWGMMVYDSLRALNYLAARPEVDAARIGTLGLSMGSTMAWWLAALDERIRVCVDLCCLTDFQALIETGHLSGHGIYYYVPGLLKSFTTAGINALIAPRPHLSLAGDLDPLTPPAGLDRIDRELRRVYADMGCPGNWKLSRYPVGHQETAGMRREALAFLEAHL